jgi:hypothetical protein
MTDPAATGPPRISGAYWSHQPRGWLAIIRCMVGRHRPAMSGDLSDGARVDRCTCGAIRMDRDGCWLDREYRLHRVSRRESAEIIAADRRREEQWAEIRRRWAGPEQEPQL